MFDFQAPTFWSISLKLLFWLLQLIWSENIELVQESLFVLSLLRCKLRHNRPTGREEKRDSANRGELGDRDRIKTHLLYVDRFSSASRELF